jgi:hypothetical protein
MPVTGEQLRVLLVKPYQPTRLPIACPPLGLLYLAATLRQRFGSDVDVRVVDLSIERRRCFDARELLQTFRPDVVGLGALNWEAEESGQFALMIQNEFPGCPRGPVRAQEHHENLRDRRLRLDLRRRSGLVVPDRLRALVSRRQGAGRHRRSDLAGRAGRALHQQRRSPAHGAQAAGRRD